MTADKEGSQKKEPRRSVPVLPLKNICPIWNGSLIPTEFAALLRGIEREKARLHELRFLAFRFRREIVKRVVLMSVEILDGFPDQASAVRSTDQAAAEALAAISEPWYRDDSEWLQPLLSD